MASINKELAFPTTTPPLPPEAGIWSEQLLSSPKSFAIIRSRTRLRKWAEWHSRQFHNAGHKSLHSGQNHVSQDIRGIHEING